LREALELAALAVEKAAPLHEVFWWISTDDLLGESADGHVRLRHLAGDGDESRHIGVDRPDRRAQACHGHL
jgi:hypothetical protein